MAAGRDVDAAYDEHTVTVTQRKREAAGVRAVLVSLQRGLQQMGLGDPGSGDPWVG